MEWRGSNVGYSIDHSWSNTLLVFRHWCFEFSVRSASCVDGGCWLHVMVRRRRVFRLIRTSQAQCGISLGTAMGVFAVLRKHLDACGRKDGERHRTAPTDTNTQTQRQPRPRPPHINVSCLLCNFFESQNSFIFYFGCLQKLQHFQSQDQLYNVENFGWLVGVAPLVSWPTFTRVTRPMNEVGSTRLWIKRISFVVFQGVTKKMRDEERIEGRVWRQEDWGRKGFPSIAHELLLNFRGSL